MSHSFSRSWWWRDHVGRQPPGAPHGASRGVRPATCSSEWSNTAARRMVARTTKGKQHENCIDYISGRAQGGRERTRRRQPPLAARARPLANDLRTTLPTYLPATALHQRWSCEGMQGAVKGCGRNAIGAELPCGNAFSANLAEPATLCVGRVASELQPRNLGNICAGAAILKEHHQTTS